MADATNNVPMTVVNLTNEKLAVYGSRGDDLTNVAVGRSIAPGESLVVAEFNYPSSGDNYDWVCLRDVFNNYQIYIEVNHGGNDYAYFGYNNADSSEKDSNPSPFPDDQTYYAIEWPSSGGTIGPIYYLLATPDGTVGSDTADSNWVVKAQGRQ